MVLTKGWDMPKVACCILARPGRICTGTLRWFPMPSMVLDFVSKDAVEIDKRAAAWFFFYVLPEGADRPCRNRI